MVEKVRAVVGVDYLYLCAFSVLLVHMYSFVCYLCVGVHAHTPILLHLLLLVLVHLVTLLEAHSLAAGFLQWRPAGSTSLAVC